MAFACAIKLSVVATLPFASPGTLRRLTRSSPAPAQRYQHGRGKNPCNPTSGGVGHLAGGLTSGESLSLTTLHYHTTQRKENFKCKYNFRAHLSISRSEFSSTHISYALHR